MTLPADLIRCRGAGHWGRVCLKRETCARYLAIQADQTQPNPHPRLSYADWLCRDDRHRDHIPTEPPAHAP